MSPHHSQLTIVIFCISCLTYLDKVVMQAMHKMCSFENIKMNTKELNYLRMNYRFEKIAQTYTVCHALLKL